MVLNEQLKIPNFRELIKISWNRSEWKSQTPLQKWCYLYGIGRASFTFLGFTTFKEDQTLSWNVCIPFFCTVVYTILAIYTTFYCIVHGEPSKILPCTCLLVGPVYSVRLSSFVSLDKSLNS